ncbi:MAG: ATP-binding cassette domain-containing protein [Clostridiales bacterium]|nr:ATP-binding cassette domain-containing protein [Clostridiales bacterium]
MEDKRLTKASWLLMSQLLEVESIDEALSGSLEIIVQQLNCEAGAIWLLNKKTDLLTSVFHIGPVDLTNISVENGVGVEGSVTKTGESIIVEDTSSDIGYDGSVFDDHGLVTKTLICVPIRNVKDVIGCLIVANKTDGTSYDKQELALCEHMSALAGMTIAEKGLSLPDDGEREVLASLRNVTKDFQNGDTVNHVLRGINLDIYRNEFVVILGESGCGKTTMMNIIGGMDSLTDGELIIEGQDFSHPSDLALTEYRRNYVGFIFQQYNLMPNLTALENVNFIAELVDDPMSPEEAIDKVRLTDRANNYPGQMSGGQQQRVSIARAIVKKPSLILADEPTAALDYSTSIEVLEVIEDIIKSKGTTVVMVTHNAEIAKMADRVIKLRNGRISSIKRNLEPLKAKELNW